MSDTSSPGTTTAPRQLRRIPDGGEGRIIGGVAGGLGRYTDVDPVIFRVLFGALTFVGGLGFGLYLLGWFLIPADGQDDSRAYSFVTRAAGRRRWIVWLLVGLLIWGATTDYGPWWHGHAFFVPPVLIVMALIIAGATHRNYGGPRHWHQMRAAAASPAAPSDVPTAEEPLVSFTEVPVAGFNIPAVKVEPRAFAERHRPSRALLPTFALLVAAWGMLALLGSTGAVSVSPLGAVATTLIVLTVGLIASAIVGRSVLLILAELLAIGALVIAAPLPSGIGWSVGNQSWQPQTVGELPHDYTLAAGAATLDLTETQGLQGRTIRATVGAGRLVVRVPANLPVQLHAHISAGQVDTYDNHWNGVGVDRRELVPGTDSTLIPLNLDLKVGYGRIDLKRVTPTASTS